MGRRYGVTNAKVNYRHAATKKSEIYSELPKGTPVYLIYTEPDAAGANWTLLAWITPWVALLSFALLRDWRAMNALLLGEREALSEEDRQAFARVGIAHVLAVSGLHISLLVSAIRLLVGRFLSGRKQLWLFGAFLALYALLLDLRASVVRASILTFAYLYTRARGRKGDSLSALALAFMVILLVWVGWK